MTLIDAFFLPLQLGGLVPTGTRVVVFEVIFRWFLILGTLVGIVVVSYMLWNAYKYRATGDEDEYADDRPEMGEIPTGGGKGRKLFLSFGMSALIVLSLIIWTYGAVLYVEQPAQEIAEDGEEPVEITVTGYQFGWEFSYDNYDYTSNNELVVPKDRPISLTITSRDVFHNFGIPAFRVKADAVPGQTQTEWFIADETSSEDDPFLAKCYELCGSAHSAMAADVVVLSESDWQDWKENNLESSGNESVSSGDGSVTDEGSESPDSSIDQQPVAPAGRIAPGAVPARAVGN